MDKQREGCCTVEEEGENSFFLLLNVQFGIGFFFFLLLLYALSLIL